MEMLAYDRRNEIKMLIYNLLEVGGEGLFH